MKKSAIVLLGTAVAFLPQYARAFCFQPSAPNAPFASIPSAPFCSIQGDSYSRCSDFAINNFKSELEDYIQEMKTFAREAIDYANQAQNYAVCGIENASNEWEDFLRK